ncbi:unnamed protein product [Ophioblennius macclurei]
MGKKRSTGRRLNVSNMKKAGSLIKSSKDSKDLALVRQRADSQTPAAPPEPQTTNESHLGFPDTVYRLASVVFQNHHLEKVAAHRLVNYGKERGLSLPDVKDEVMQCSAHELAFNTLKYQELLEDIMTDSCFYLAQPMPDDQMSLVAVMLYDFQDRQFLPRKHQEGDVIPEVRHVEKYLLRFKTKLAASLARCRVKYDLLSIECTLPESMRKKQERSRRLPLYAWVNTLKSSVDEVRGVLKSAGFSRAESIGRLAGQTFCHDPHCEDTLVFPAHMKAQLFSTKLLSQHKLVVQDKSCSVGPNAACALLPEEGDVLMAGSFSALTLSHTASLIAEKHKGNSQPTVYACVSDCTDAQKEELQLAVATMGCKNVTLIQKVFGSLDWGDKRLQKVHVILLIPKCSVSGISKPVEFILQENGDTDLLQNLSQGSIAQSKLEALVAQQQKDIDHALKFPKVSAVVYLTRSTYPEENVDVVNKALLQSNAGSDQEEDSKQANFRISCHPLISSHHSDTTEETNPFFTLEPSDHSDGCFLAVLKREPEPEVKPAPEEVIARANAKGILDGISSNHLGKKNHQGHITRTKTAAQARTFLPNLSLSIQSKSQQSKGRDSAALGGHQEVSNKQQSLQVKPRLTYSKRGMSSTHSFSSSSSTQPESITATKSVAPLPSTKLAITTSAAAAPIPPPPTPAAPAARPRRAPQEVLRPVVLAFPPLNFPNLSPRHSREGIGLSLGKWKTPAQIVSHLRSAGGLSKDAVGKSRPQLCLHKL